MNWIPAISTTGLFAVALWLLRNLILNRLGKSVQHEFDTKIEALKSEMRRKETEFASQLQSRDDAIASIRSAALTALTANRAELDKRRIEAVDQLLGGLKALSSGEWFVSFVASLNIQYVSERIETDQKLREVFKTLFSGLEKLPEALSRSDADLARPYVSEMTWALYFAYAGIVQFCGSVLWLLRNGVPAKSLLDVVTLSSLVKTAIPEYAAYVDTYGIQSYHYVVQELKLRLMSSLRADVEGHASSETTMTRAMEILRATDSLRVLPETKKAETAIASAAAADAGSILNQPTPPPPP